MASAEGAGVERGTRVWAWLLVLAGVLLNATVVVAGPAAPGCGPGACELAAVSPWSQFPPAPPIGSPSIPRVPVAAIALALFAAQAATLATSRQLSRDLATLTAAGSAAYLVLGLRVLDAPCLLCLASHAVAFALAATAFLGRGEWSPRRALVRLAVGAVASGGLVALSAPSTQSLVDAWGAAPRVDAGRAPVVVFADPACASCRAFQRFESHRLAGLEVQWRYVPAPGDWLAPALVAAEDLGLGPVARSWVARVGPRTATLADLAEALALDLEVLEGATRAETVDDRLARDLAAARAVGLTHLPTVYLDGRAVPRRALTWYPFWRRATSP